jgi:ribonuclease P protein component
MDGVCPESGAETTSKVAGDGGLLQTLGKAQRLRKTREFRETYAQGNRVVGRYIVLWRRQADDTSLRLGVVASRKVGNAVKRARAKRLLREAFRRNRESLNGPDDIVLVARRAILTATWDSIVDELLLLAKKSGIHKGKGQH